MKKTLGIVLGSFILIFASIFVYIRMNSNTYNIYVDNYATDQKIVVAFSNDNVIKVKDMINKNDKTCIVLESVNEGTTDITVTVKDPNDEDSYYIKYIHYDYVVNEHGSIFASSDGNNFNHWQILFIGEALYFWILCIYCIKRYLYKIKNDIFNYRTIVTCVNMIFTGVFAIVFSISSIFSIIHYTEYSAYYAISVTTNLVTYLVILSIPFVLIFTISMMISNLQLIHKEGYRVVNALGFMFGLIIFIGTLLFAYGNFYVNLNFISSNVYLVVKNSIATIILFFMCMFVAVMLCAFISVKQKHAYNQDFLIILGCGIREDGTLYPLLQGRVDAAIHFYHDQMNNNGKKAYFIPSGGKGNDEIISEAEAMKRYLLSKNIPEEQILIENQSSTTYENMMYSKKIIDDMKQDANVLFFTTNYHVYRSGMFTKRVNLKAGGVGAPTKWYFWPNAFVREFIGLVVAYRRQEIFFLFILILVSYIMLHFELIIYLLF